MEIVRDTAARVQKAAEAGELTLVLGGDCTTGIGTVAGHVASGSRVGLVYFDGHADLNVPESVREGALDWMGLAHMISESGTAPELVAAGGRTPLLRPEQVVLLGWDPEQATAFERAALERHGIPIVALDEVAAAPEQAARRALELLPPDCERVLVHFDVDVIDFTDMPLSENTGRNEGLSYACVTRALRALLDDPRLAGVTITELNPEHAESRADLADFAAMAAAAVAGAAAR